MKPLPTQQRAILKRESLLIAAEQEFGEKDYEQVTAKTIAARAGVATGTFYQYFDNKQQMLLMLAQQRFDLLHSTLLEPNLLPEEVSVEQAQTLFTAVISFIYEFHQNSPQFHQVLEHRRCVDPELDQIIVQGESILIEHTCQFAAMMGHSDNSEAVGFCLFAMAEGIVHRHVFGNSKISKTEIINLGANMLAAFFEQQTIGN